MSDDNEAYEQRRADADRMAEMEAAFDPEMARPVPPGFDADRDVDRDKVERLIFDGAPPDAKADIEAGRLRWALHGWDPQGWGTVSVFRADTGDEVAGSRFHWTAVARAESS